MCDAWPHPIVRPLTRACGTAPDGVALLSPIEQHETIGVDSLLSLKRAMDAIAAPRSLLYSSPNFAAYQGKARPSIGAPRPALARESYTRNARRVQRQRQMARRSGAQALLRAFSQP